MIVLVLSSQAVDKMWRERGYLPDESRRAADSGPHCDKITTSRSAVTRCVASDTPRTPLLPAKTLAIARMTQQPASVPSRAETGQRKSEALRLPPDVDHSHSPPRTNCRRICESTLAPLDLSVCVPRRFHVQANLYEARMVGYVDVALMNGVFPRARSSAVS